MLVQVVDFVVFRLQGNAICNVGEVAIAPESVPEQTFTPLEWGLLELCQARSLPMLQCPSRYISCACHAINQLSQLKQLYAKSSLASANAALPCALSQAAPSDHYCLLQLASLAALLLAWLFVFDTTNKERASLEGFREGIVGAVPDAQSQVAIQRHLWWHASHCAGLILNLPPA